MRDKKIKFLPLNILTETEINDIINYLKNKLCEKRGKVLTDSFPLFVAFQSAILLKNSV